MSVKVMSWVFEQTELAGMEKLVMLALADHCSDDGVAWPSVERIALKSSVSKRTAQRTLKALEAADWLARKGGSRHSTTRYTMNFSRGANLSPLKDEGCQMVHLGVTPSASRGDTCCHPNHQEPSIEPSNTMVDFEKEFEEFWDSTPSRGKHPNPKKPAKLAFIRQRKAGVPAEAIIEGVRRYWQWLYDTGGLDPDRQVYIPQAVTWLNQERWEQQLNEEEY